MRALLTSLLLLAACATMSPVGPAPIDPPADPDAGPAATPCERAGARYVQLRCGSLTVEEFAKTCEGYADLGGSSGYDPVCMQKAADCSALSDCRGGT